MANVTISIDEETLRRARIRALERGTSVNALVREYLERLVGDDAGMAAARRFVARSERTASSSGGAGRRWRREDVYDT
jgi:plasmid stability protein